MRKLIFVLIILMLFIFVGCAENRDVEVVIKDHEVKTVIVDGKQKERYYLTVQGDDFVAGIEVFPKVGMFVYSTFEQQFPLEMVIVVKEKDLKIIEGEIK
jgi:hypothetical protein